MASSRDVERAIPAGDPPIVRVPLELDGVEDAASIEIWAPRFDIHRDNWSCCYAIRGVAGPRAAAIFGVDAMQALACGLMIVTVELSILDEYRDGRLTRHGEGSFELIAPLVVREPSADD